MTSAVPAHRTAPQMTHTPDPAATPQAQATESAADARPARLGLRDQIAENPLLSLFGGLMVALLTLLGTVVVALLLFTLTSINDRMDRLEDDVHAGFAAQGAQIAEIDRKLTALIATLNATGAVDAALEGRLLTPGDGVLRPEGEHQSSSSSP